MACEGLEFIGEIIRHKGNKIIYTKKWIQGELKRTIDGCLIDGVGVAPDTVGQLAHRRIKSTQSDTVNWNFKKRKKGRT